MDEQRILYLSKADVKSVEIDMSSIINLLAKAFREKGEGRIEMPPKPGIHTQPDAFIHAMPAYIPAFGSAGMKWVSGYPDNQKRGLPYISGLIILNDIETGIPYSVMDCTWITAYRTAGATALSAKYLARQDSEVVGIIACGVQGRTNLQALASIFPIKNVFAYDLSAEAQQKFIAEMSVDLNLEIIGVDDPQKAVMESDIVVTSGPILKHPTPTIAKNWLRKGAFASAIDFDSYWKPKALSQMDKISTDDHAQFRYYQEVGYFQKTPLPYADLGEIVTGQKPGRENNKERTMAINLGLALDDMAVAPEIYRRACEKGIGTWLSL
jgi:ornithine cyclodeaminase/alanine dehydrogenase-like protein (mu-crystallin family)